MKPILEIQNISKKFRINHEQQPYLSLRDSFSNFFNTKKSTEDFLALHNVSFNVLPGDTVGIIGKNGAGKSTLLKILSKITPPTSGKIITRGRIASLLEVGTGFHPELNGRENVFMNGSILGMKRTEIIKNFDAIIDFAGVEKFIDTPLKHYSSGMQLRLAFAVAAFLENEVLIIDEVLAVGDAEFQKKCMGKMDDVSKSGRTILFVSHNFGAVANLCKNGVLINSGKTNGITTIDSAIEEYNKINFNSINQNFSPQKRIGKGSVIVNNIKINNTAIKAGEELTLEVKISKPCLANDIDLDIRIDSHLNEKCIWISTKLMKYSDSTFDKIIFTIPKLGLNTGMYSITYCLFKKKIVEDSSDNCLIFEVIENNFYTNWSLPPKEQTNILTEFKTNHL